MKYLPWGSGCQGPPVAPVWVEFGGPPWNEGGRVSPTPGPRSNPGGGILSLSPCEP